MTVPSRDAQGWSFQRDVPRIKYMSPYWYANAVWMPEIVGEEQTLKMSTLLPMLE